MSQTNVIEERNVFIDSEENRIINGTQFEVDFPGAIFSVNPPEKQSLTLEQFCMPKIWPNVNYTNSWFFLCAQVAGSAEFPKLTPYPIKGIEEGDYYAWSNGSANELAQKLEDTINDTLSAVRFGGGGLTWNGYTYPINNDWPATLEAHVNYDKVTNTIEIFFALAATPTVPHNYPNNFICWQFYQVRDNSTIETAGFPSSGVFPGLNPVETKYLIGADNATYNDSFALLGGRATRNNDMQFNGWKQDGPYTGGAPFAQKWNSWYPVRLRTLDQIYLHCSIPGNNYNSIGFSQDSSKSGTALTPSTILAKIPLPPDWCYEPSAKVTEAFICREIVWDDPNNLFGVTTDSQKLGTLKFWLTDRNGRPLPEWDVGQKEYGNLNCRLTLRWSKLYTAPPVEPASDYIKNPMPDQIKAGGANTDDNYMKRAQLMGHKIV